MENRISKKLSKPFNSKRLNNLKTKDLNSEEGSLKILDEATLKKYSKGEHVKFHKIRRGLAKKRLKHKEKQFQEAEEVTARAEILLTESSGALEADELSYTSHITQREINKAVDITAATKGFDLLLDRWGPYKFRYSDSGRHLVLGGRKGHVATFDWVTKKLGFETNVSESVHDVCFLGSEQMMAVAQKEFTYIYDGQGTEIHCLKRFHRTVKLEYLPYHFLLCAGSESGFLRWVDISLGQEILQFPTRRGKLDVMCQNPSNAVICCGHSNGTVTMWTPNAKEPVFSMLCHPHSLTSMAIDPYGRVMATACNNRLLRIWDLRNLGKAMSSFKIDSPATQMAFSQKQLLALSRFNTVEVYRNCAAASDMELYMRHKERSGITSLQFCPFEDVLGCSTVCGYASLLIPGSGEPNFDAWEQNPYRGKDARKEAEVKRLLEKIPSELITLDPNSISQVDTMRFEEKLEVQKQLSWVKVPQFDIKPRHRMKGKSGSAQKFKRKLKVKEAERSQYLNFIKAKREALQKPETAKQEAASEEILDRFKSKKKNKK